MRIDEHKVQPALIEIALQVAFLIGGIVLVGLGSNFYLAFGLTCLIIYSKNHK